MTVPATPVGSAPLILTLTLDAEATRFFNELRQAHFPPERNFLAAHLTMFHHLPGPELASVQQTLHAVTQAQAPLPLLVAGLQFLGQGVAYRVESEALLALHRGLQQQWAPWLTPQDQQKRRPHVTVQNKVRPEVARALYEELTASFQPFPARGTGLHLWVYRNGPWESVQAFPFGG